MKFFAGTAAIAEIHVTDAALAGADLATLPPAVLRQMVHRPLADKGLAQFLADWKGMGQSIL